MKKKLKLQKLKTWHFLSQWRYYLQVQGLSYWMLKLKVIFFAICTVLFVLCSNEVTFYKLSNQKYVMPDICCRREKVLCSLFLWPIVQWKFKECVRVSLWMITRQIIAEALLSTSLVSFSKLCIVIALYHNFFKMCNRTLNWTPSPRVLWTTKFRSQKYYMDLLRITEI